jgi:hypothetical protein
MSSPPPPGPGCSGADRDPDPWPGSAARSRPPRAAPLSDPLVPPDLRGWVRRVCEVVHRSLVPLLLVQGCVAAVGVVLSYALPPPPAGAPVGDPQATLAALGLSIALAVGVLAQGTSVYVAIQDAAGHPPTLRQALRFAAERAPALVGWGMAAALLTMLGCVLLIVPGLYLAVVFGASLAGVVTVERGTPARCFELVNARFWPTAGRMALAVTAGVVYTAVSSYVVRALSVPGSFDEAVLRAVAAVPLGMVAVGVAVVTYAELRFHERGEVFTPVLAAELHR